MLSTFNSIDDMWSNFKNILLNAMGKHVPSKLTSSRPTYPWITTAVRRGINRKNKAGRKARKTNKPKDRERYRKLKAHQDKPITTMFMISLAQNKPKTQNDSGHLSNRKKQDNSAGRKGRKTKKPKDRERYRKLKAQVQRTSRQAYSNYVHDIISPEQTENPKRFWSFIKSRKTR